MTPPPDEDRRPPLVVRYLLANVRTRSAAVWLVVATGVFVAVAVALQDVVLVAIAVLGLAAYLWSIRWMDRHDAWRGAVEPGAAPGEALGADLAATPPAEVADPGSRPGAVESLRRSAFDTAPAAAAPTPGDAGTCASRSVARAFAALIVVATITQLGSLVALEAGGDNPTGAHLVEVMLDALFGLGFGAFGVIVALQRHRLPAPRVLSVIASGGLGLVAGLGYYIGAGGLAGATSSGPGMVAAWLVGTGAAGAGVWLTATSGGRLGLALVFPTVVIGWFLGVGTWFAHIRSV